MDDHEREERADRVMALLDARDNRAIVAQMAASIFAATGAHLERGSAARRYAMRDAVGDARALLDAVDAALSAPAQPKSQEPTS